MTRATDTPRERILGVYFFNSTAADAIAHINAIGGCAVMPASPALTKLSYDESYRAALQAADVVLPDSELLVLIWKLVSGQSLRKISGIDYLRELAREPSFRDARKVWIVATADAKERGHAFLSRVGAFGPNDHFLIRDQASASGQDHAVLQEIEARKPEHVVIALRGGQEQLGIYLRDYLLHRPRIHCVGAALGLLSGEERAIPRAFERLHIGWLARLLSQPRLILPRIGIALSVAIMIIRYRSELPPLQPRWADL